MDDHFQGVSEIVRGADLIEPTVRQISLYQLFGWKVPDYIHLPLALNPQGAKPVSYTHLKYRQCFEYAHACRCSNNLALAHVTRRVLRDRRGDVAIAREHRRPSAGRNVPAGARCV